MPAKCASFARRARSGERSPTGARAHGVGGGHAARELALGQREVGAADPGRLAGHEHARDGRPHVLVVGDGVLAQLAAERAGEVDGREEAVGGADRVDLEGALLPAGDQSGPASAIVALCTRPSPSARTITWPQTIRRTFVR